MWFPSHCNFYCLFSIKSDHCRSIGKLLHRPSITITSILCFFQPFRAIVTGKWQTHLAMQPKCKNHTFTAHSCNLAIWVSITCWPNGSETGRAAIAEQQWPRPVPEGESYQGMNLQSYTPRMLWTWSRARRNVSTVCSINKRQTSCPALQLFLLPSGLHSVIPERRLRVSQGIHEC